MSSLTVDFIISLECRQVAVGSSDGPRRAAPPVEPAARQRVADGAAQWMCDPPLTS